MLDKSGARVKRTEGRAGAACARLLTIIRVGIARIGPLQPWEIRVATRRVANCIIIRDVVEMYAEAYALPMHLRRFPTGGRQGGGGKNISHRGLPSAITRAQNLHNRADEQRCLHKHRP